MNMSKQTDKSVKKKTKKHMKTSTKNRAIVTTVIIVLVLLVFSYFAYTTGLPAKVLPGAKIVQTVDGKEKTLERIKIVEMNYYFQKAVSQLSQYGLLSDSSSLDEVYNPDSGQTYRDMLWENAANTVQSQYMLMEEAKKSGFKASGADMFADSQVESLRETVTYYNTIRGTSMTADQYLQNVYGPGMTVHIFHDIVEREAEVTEYQSYLRQTQFAPDAAAIQAKYDEDPQAYQLCQYQAYFVAADIPEGATEEVKKEKLDEALAKAHELCDNCKNEVEFQVRVSTNATEEYRERMANGEDPTTFKDITKSGAMNMSEEFAEMCFNPETKEYTSMAFIDSQQTGAYATLFQKVYLDEEPTASYRVISLTDDLLGDISKTLEEKAPSHQKFHAQLEQLMGQVNSEEDFIRLAKENTMDADTILAGGYTSGVKDSGFKRITTEEGGEAKLPDEDQKLIDWLFDANRKKGDMYIIDCVDSVKLYYFCDCMEAWKTDIYSALDDDNYTTWYNQTTTNDTYSTIVNHGLIKFFS